MRSAVARGRDRRCNVADERLECCDAKLRRRQRLIWLPMLQPSVRQPRPSSSFRADAVAVRADRVQYAAMTTPGNYNTDVSDMYAVHRAIIGALDAAPAYVANAGLDASVSRSSVRSTKT